MKIHTKQKNAKEWNKTLNKLNQAQVGKIAITYLDKESKKRVGYTDLTNIELEISDKTILLGELLEMLIKNNADLKKSNAILSDLAHRNAKEIENIQGFIEKYLKNGVM
jgi:hypothetical protein